MEFTENYDWKNTDKSGILLHLKINNDIITNPNQISNAFCLFLQMSALNTQIRYVDPKSNFEAIAKIVLN